MSRDLVAIVFAACALSCLWMSSSRLSYVVASDPQLQKPERSLASLCNRIDRIRDISTMEQLIGKLKEELELLGNSDYAEFYRKQTTIGRWLTPTRMKPMADAKVKCVRYAAAILDLEPIIAERRSVCTSKHLDRIEEYKLKYLPGSMYLSKTNITQNFFVMYAGQVSAICKKNILKSLRAAERQLITSHDFERINLLLKQPADCDMSASGGSGGDGDQDANNGNRDNYDAIQALRTLEDGNQMNSSVYYSDKLGQVGSGQLPLNEADKRRLRCNALNVLSEIKSIDQLVAMLGLDFKWNNSAEQENSSGAETGPADSRDNPLDLIFEERMSDSARENVDKILEVCPRFERVYSHNILSIVRLAQMGFDPNFKKFDEACKEQAIIQKWFGITFVCSSLLNSTLAKSRRTGENNNNNNREFSELDARRLAEVNYSPIEDHLWIGKYLPGRFSKLSTDFINSIKKKLHIEDDGLFLRSMRRVGVFIAIVLAMTASLYSMQTPGLVLH